MSTDELSFDVTVRLDDLLALQMRCVSTWGIRADWRQQELLLVLASPLMAAVGLVGGMLMARMGDTRPMSFGESLRWLLADEPATVYGAVLVMLAVSLVIVVLGRVLARPRVRRLLRRSLRVRPDVDRADPQLAYRAQVVVGDAGVESRTAIGATRIGWGALKWWEEAGGRILLLGDMMVGFCVPVTGTDPGALDRFRAALAARLGPKR